MDRATRIRVFTAITVVAIAILSFQAVTADPGSGVVHADDNAYPGDTLITVQSFDSFFANNGKAMIVTPDGEIRWEYEPPNSRVFDGEMLPNGTILLSVATAIPSDECPREYRSTARYPTHCVENRVIEVDPATNNIVWEYAWYDAFTHWHEVHDADRLPTGETAVADMGNDRAFTVNRTGEITWEWHAKDHIGPGTAFWNTHVPPARRDKLQQNGPHDDWTHINDIDALPSGHFQVSIRNFDVILEIDPATNNIMNVIGRPGNHEFMFEQHDPNRLDNGTIIIADSKNNRVIERDLDTGRLVWSYTGRYDRLQWPRDADRLPNGNTLIADSRNARVREINGTGDTVWEYSLRQDSGIVYDADRLGLPEEPDNVPNGRHLTSTGRNRPSVDTLRYVESWLALVFPPWVRFLEFVVLVVGGAALLGLTIDITHARLTQDRD